MNWEEQASACWHLLCGPRTSHWHPLHAPPPRPQSRKHVPTSHGRGVGVGNKAQRNQEAGKDSAEQHERSPNRNQPTRYKVRRTEGEPSAN